MSNRYDSILLWLQTENGLMILSYSHTRHLEMLSHLKITMSKEIFHTFGPDPPPPYYIVSVEKQKKIWSKNSF